MPALTPINRSWIARQARRANSYGATAILRLYLLPVGNKILPEHLAAEPLFDLELMLVCLRAGAWLNGKDWHPFARYTIAKRLKDRSDLLFPNEYAQYAKAIRSYQLHGGLNSVRDELRRVARNLQQGPASVIYDKALAGLITSITHPIEDNTYIQPFHWIRTTLAASHWDPMYGMNLYNSEMKKQKETLCTMLHGTIG
jgi:hypothetical protein